MPDIPHLRAPASEHVYTSYAERFPPEGGPPPVANYTSAQVLTEAGDPVTVVLDPGAFRAIWELVEATAKHRWDTRVFSLSAAAYIRGVEAFRAAVSGPAPAASTPRERPRMIRPSFDGETPG
jgi:hypothetical protein